jgi:plastocyanin
MHWRLGIACLLCCCAWPLAAADAVVSLLTAGGAPVSDAVVTLSRVAPKAAAEQAREPSTTYIIDQRHETFLPYVQVFRPGDKVVFRNSDTTRHHVYSFSDIKAFEFVLRPGESSPPLVLDKQGIAAVGCNIHDHMVTYLFVSSAAAIAMSDRGGHATFGHLAPGRYSVHVWHPQLHPGRPEPVQAMVVTDDAIAKVAFKLSLMPDPRRFVDREQLDY